CAPSRMRGACRGWATPAAAAPARCGSTSGDQAADRRCVAVEAASAPGRAAGPHGCPGRRRRSRRIVVDTRFGAAHRRTVHDHDQRPIIHRDVLRRLRRGGRHAIAHPGPTLTFHIPVGTTPESGSDHHLVVINQDTWQELDMWLASFSNGSWSAGSRYLTDATGWGAICALGQHCGGAVAAGFAAFGG